MKITVYGATENEEYLFSYFIRWALEYRLGKENTANITIDLTFTDDVYNRKRWAEIIPVDFLDGYPYAFHMNIARHITVMQSFRLIAHEVSHVVQYVSGDYVAGPNDSVVWLDQEYSSEHFQEGFEPWELEARGYEWALVETFVKENDYQYQNWYQPLK